MQYMKAHDVEVLCFPPHCTHLMQPLDDVPFGGLKKAYQREILDYNFCFPAKKLSKLKFFRVLVPAYTKSMSEKAIKAEFENCGIYPVNPKATKLLTTWPSLISDKHSKLKVNLGLYLDTLIFQRDTSLRNYCKCQPRHI